MPNTGYNWKMKLLITGGLGYIGSHLAIELKKNFDCEVILLDNLSSGKQSRNILNLDFETTIFLITHVDPLVKGVKDRDLVI